MSKVKCKGCRKYIDKEGALRQGLSHYCDRGCMKYPRRKPPKPGVSTELYETVLEQDNWVCRNCGSRFGRLHVHHIRFRSAGGTHTLDNLVVLCEKCHTKVHASTRAEYEPYLFRITELRQQGDRATRVVDLKRKEQNENRTSIR